MITKAQAKYTHSEHGKAKMKLYRFIHSYGITLEDYNRLFEWQHGVCAICGNAETIIMTNGKIKPLSVDHSHSDKHTRGLLCQRCNALLGMANDNVDRLLRAANYLEGVK